MPLNITVQGLVEPNPRSKPANNEYLSTKNQVSLLLNGMVVSTKKIILLLKKLHLNDSSQVLNYFTELLCDTLNVAKTSIRYAVTGQLTLGLLQGLHLSHFSKIKKVKEFKSKRKELVPFSKGYNFFMS